MPLELYSLLSCKLSRRSVNMFIEDRVSALELSLEMGL